MFFVSRAVRALHSSGSGNPEAWFGSIYKSFLSQTAVSMTSLRARR
jgi:hypothetical protein